MGRTFLNALHNLGVMQPYQHALSGLGYDMEKVQQAERDAALGNGGLGRLASCFLDSMATLNLPAWGYGIDASTGCSASRLGGLQKGSGLLADVQVPGRSRGPTWLTRQFYGHVSVHESQDGGRTSFGMPGRVTAAIRQPHPEVQDLNTINLRLWAAKPCRV